MSDYFHLAELVPPAIYTRFGEQRAWNFVNRRAYKNLIKLRKYLGKPLIINNYHCGGEREWSGFRTPESPYFSATSQHAIANAYDIICVGLTPQEMQAVIQEKYQRFNIGGLEIAPSWTHIDWRFNPDQELTVFHLT
ncbi:hypothetical protein [Candidatus Endoriftia persephone]|jgi:hypothetical protein|uniref:Uncharacterized protein n=3 Tax=Gammaproteobacteria TaxID=1236 RepID=G2FIB7_9GAMM|nr:hypothetical protein [Candidatus Endoriftia persephone]EGV52881.1 hypothetical protein Rifp1Sym_aa00390 [endosymbiont of Riftia pachyptila (vent Ph05)]EGW53470.1 hypothetical protein TevJSym_bb00250 [endosymbiont of Tevnia jerichonana (vent Tica)]USF87589.1 hypothetical protein L0Y14_15945 [Candidatus Endoriftia persephone]